MFSRDAKRMSQTRANSIVTPECDEDVAKKVRRLASGDVALTIPGKRDCVIYAVELLHKCTLGALRAKARIQHLTASPRFRLGLFYGRAM